ncbi:p53-like transcription factor, partial [Acephala macrosclerotiorum]
MPYGNTYRNGSPTHVQYDELPSLYSSQLPSKRAFRGEDLPKAAKATNQDHQLASFSQLPEKHTILDSQGRVQHVELAAQIHGMFFISELETPSEESLLVQSYLICYRRNLFQISGSVTAPNRKLFITDRVPIISMEVTIGATESVNGHIVKLIVIPWKTPPPNASEIPTGQKQEPAPIPLLPFNEGPNVNNDFTTFPIAYERLQFRIATANNGRRRELQQYFTLQLNVVGTLTNGTKVNLCETSTVPIVVRGRSPRNFQAKKETPLPGSSSSRGQPPELHIASNLNNSLIPQSPFAFDSSNISGFPLTIHQPIHPWNIDVLNSSYVNNPPQDNYNFSGERFVDSNPR